MSLNTSGGAGMNDEMFLRPRARQVSLEAQRNASMQVEHLSGTMGWVSNGSPLEMGVILLLRYGLRIRLRRGLEARSRIRRSSFRRHCGWNEGRVTPEELMFISRTHSVPILILGGTGGLWMQRQNGYAAVLPCGLLPIQSVTESSSLLLHNPYSVPQ